MSSLSGAVETAPVTSLHAHRSADPDDFAVPTGREEEWRFTPLRRLRNLHKDARLSSSGVTVEIDAAPEIDSSERIIAPGDVPGFLADDRVSARAYAASGFARVLTVPKEAVASRPTVVRVTGTGADEAVAGHLIIDVQPFGRAVVVLDQRGSATYADNVEIHVGDGGDLTVVSVAEWADDAVQVSHHQATLGRDAKLKHFQITLGGSVVRVSPSVRYAGPGGDAELYGICFATALPTTGGQHLEHRLFVDHDPPNCRSRVVYKGALSGADAHTVWIGDVLIRPGAEGTDTYEFNRNLVLTDGARADSVPNLEILTGEVAGAGHASANGRLDDEHIFYLRARGIPESEARRLVIRGFFAELIDKIGVPEIEERVTEKIEAELTGSLVSSSTVSPGDTA
ncbi:MAG: Fe-S cluster assembly protein SufD [Nocardiopsaceae bacterium]|nr:Fe-S cluster assembly protein SufD [Nocardiopsaceae bacterium]